MDIEISSSSQQPASPTDNLSSALAVTSTTVEAATHPPVVTPIAKLLQEISRVSHRLESTIAADWLMKRILFIGYELQTFIGSSQIGSSQIESSKLDSPKISAADKLALLNRFFFGIKQFKCINDSDFFPHPADGLKLSRVLSTRVGDPLLLEMIYAYLAEGLGIELEFVDLKPIGFLKWRDGGNSRYIDLSREGKTLTNDELIDILHVRFNMTSMNEAVRVLESCSIESFANEYLSALKRALYSRPHEPEALLFVQDLLITYQPQNFQLFGERALLHHRLGNLKLALSDLKRYFAFNDQSRVSSELVALRSELERLLDPR